jgi:hypothetical protein
MLDPEIPPVVEGEADGDGDVARRIVQGTLAVAIASN